MPTVCGRPGSRPRARADRAVLFRRTALGDALIEAPHDRCDHRHDGGRDGLGLRLTSLVEQVCGVRPCSS